jgi:molybdopterin/thiamine biosynthesis adenylyltransferase
MELDDLYARQKKLNLKTDGVSVTVVGCGGIGYWVAKFLAMSGVETLWVFDDDEIEEHNLNRLDIPQKFIGYNKADVVKIVLNTLRPDCTVYAMPYRFNDAHTPGTNWLVDCTDNHKSQLENLKLAKQQGMRYFKAGYDGEDMSIHNNVAEWGDADDGYITVPSWVVPASMIAALAVAKILKYTSYEVVTNVKGMFSSRRIK